MCTIKLGRFLKWPQINSLHKLLQWEYCSSFYQEIEHLSSKIESGQDMGPACPMQWGRNDTAPVPSLGLTKTSTLCPLWTLPPQVSNGKLTSWRMETAWSRLYHHSLDLDTWRSHTRNVRLSAVGYRCMHELHWTYDLNSVRRPTPWTCWPSAHLRLA